MKKLKLSALNDQSIEVLTRAQMKNVLGKMMGGSGDPDAGEPHHEYMGCNYNPSSNVLTCDYHLTYQNGTERDLCEAQCIGSDGGGCMP
jgi:hypothetical protein